MNRTLASCLAATTGLVALAGAFVVGTTVGPVAAPDAPPDRPRTPYAGAGIGTGLVPAAFTGTDLAAGGCDDLLDHYVERGVDRVGPWGWGGGPWESAPAGGDSAADSDSAGSDAAASAPSTARQTSEASGTNVQESGVDEPDVVKTDGSLLVRVDAGDLTTYDVRGAEVERLASLDLPQVDGAEILLTGDVVVAIGAGTGGDEPTTRVVLVDVSDPADPRVVRTDDHDAALVTARLSDGVVRLVVQAGLPDLDLREPGQGLWGLLGSEDRALEANRDAVRASTLDDWLPHVSTDGGEPQALLDCDQVGLPSHDPEQAGLGTIAVVAFDPARPDERTATGLATSTDIAYASADRLYLAASPWSDPVDWSGSSGSTGCCTDDLRSSAVPDTRTRLWSFALEGLATRWVAEGEVDGEVRDRWSLDEAGGVLRVAVGPTWTGAGGDANAVVTMREEGDDLVEAGRVDGLGRGEDIQAVRWSDDLALVVTFRQVDPLHAVDLTDPDAPTLLGELEIPGFSSYLHPLGERRLLGVGEGPSQDGSRGAGGGWGAQLGLFDVTDLTAPTRLGVTSYGAGSVALAGTDPRQLTWLPERRTVLTVVTDPRGAGFVSVVGLGDGAMTERRVDVGGDPYDVRLVPLPDGRVVLATASSATFLPL